jgi:hypothetical protein
LHALEISSLQLDKIKCLLLTIAKLEIDEDFTLHHYTQDFSHHISGTVLPWVKTLETSR